MKILICNERFLFRFGVDRCLLALGKIWKAEGHTVIMMGNKLDPKAVDHCSNQFIPIPESPDYLHGNQFTAAYLREHWDEWFNDRTRPDIALVAGWPFYESIGFLKGKCGCAVFNDYGAVPTDGMSEGAKRVQEKLRTLRRENLRKSSRVIAISHFLEETQSKPDTEGLVPTSCVHIAVDHIVHPLWDGTDLNLGKSDIPDRIRKLKDAGERIIFQPGRWESGNYKNSDACGEVIRYLSRKKIPHKVLLLAKEEDLAGVPEDIRNHIFCLGYVDDATMREAMALSDVGISPTLWEGFDLPLGEMEYLGKPMFVMNIGAHPEVVSDPYFLCTDIGEMARKVEDTLQGKMPFTKDEFEQKCEKIRNTFTWQKCADNMMREFEKGIRSSVTVLIDVTNACHDTANSGVMRVTRKLSRYLQERFHTVFLLWDGEARKYVLPYDEEIKLLSAYGGPQAGKIMERSVSGQARTGAETVLSSLHTTRNILLFTETVQYSVMNAAIPWARENGFSVASVFYDAIPVIRPELCSKEVSENHKVYMKTLSQCDLILPIAKHNQKNLEDFWKENDIQSKAVVHTVELAAEIDGTQRVTEGKDIGRDQKIHILMVSTLEPRKNHIRFLKALKIVFENHPDLTSRILVHLVGNRYAGNEEIPAYVESFCKQYPNVQWLGVVDDAALQQEYRACTFTVYPSEIEGFGMPLMESLWAGKPCLCSDSGSLGELAAGGGCCPTNVMDENAIAASLNRMLTDTDYLSDLQRQALERHITTWNEYTDEVCSQFILLPPHVPVSERANLSVSSSAEINLLFKGWNGTRMILVSNFYPPNFVGGAEIIAHQQLKALQQEGLVRGIAFSLDMSETRPAGTVYEEKYEGVHVIRLCLNASAFDPNGVNFFNAVVNRVFTELCDAIKPDIVHCHNLIGMSMGVVDIAKTKGAKVFVTLHDNWGFCYKNTMLDRTGRVCDHFLNCDECKKELTANGLRVSMGVRKDYFRRVFERMDGYISPSKYLANTYIKAGFNYHKMHTLWNGIDLGRFQSCHHKASNDVRITFAGHFGPHKGIHVLIQAVAMLGNPKVKIQLIGDGEEEQHYHALARELGIEDQVVYYGKLDNSEMIRVYEETDIYCLPSVWPENQPVSITEAMACGLPVIASSLGGSKELVQDGKTGYLTEPGNAKALSEAIRKLVEQPDRRRQFGQAGKEIMAANDYSSQVRKLYELYTKSPVQGRNDSKEVILVKGTVLPSKLDRFTEKDILLLDWTLHPRDFEQARKCVVMPDVTLSREEIKAMEIHKIPLLVCEDTLDYYAGTEVLVNTYGDISELLMKISE